jgi:hypothetical protein
VSYIAHSGTTPAAVCQLRGGATQSVLPTQKPRRLHFAMAIPAAIKPYSIAVRISRPQHRARKLFEKCRRSGKDGVDPIRFKAGYRSIWNSASSPARSSLFHHRPAFRHCRCAPACRGKRHDSTAIRFRVHSATSLPTLPIGNDALPNFAVARGARLAHVRVRQMRSC